MFIKTLIILDYIDNYKQIKRGVGRRGGDPIDIEEDMPFYPP